MDCAAAAQGVRDLIIRARSDNKREVIEGSGDDEDGVTPLV
jgi:hypothetical protein